MKASYIVKQFIYLIIYFTLIFRSDGRIDDWQGIVYIVLGLVMFILNYTLFRIDPELLKKRAKPGEGTKKWTKPSWDSLFANMLERSRYGIVNHCDHPIHTGKIECVNNKIKVIKRKAY